MVESRLAECLLKRLVLSASYSGLVLVCGYPRIARACPDQTPPAWLSFSSSQRGCLKKGITQTGELKFETASVWRDRGLGNDLGGRAPLLI